MPAWDWQLLLALLCVAAAAIALVRRALRTVGRDTSKGCGACPSNEISPADAKYRNFVSLDTLRKPSDKR
jgi:hypothetical protein